MRDLSKVILRGTVSDAPRTRTFDDRKVVSFTVRTVTREPDDANYERERSAWHRVSAWGGNAERAEMLEEDAPVYVEGRLQTRKYQNQQGQEVWATEVRADIVHPVESAEPQLNRSIILGNVGRKDDMREFDSFSVTNLRVATSEGWTSRSGQSGEETEWHSVAAFRTLAQQVDKEIDKGQRVFVVGYSQTRKYTGRDGQERRSTETVAQTVIGSGKRTEQAERTARDPGFRERVQEKDRLQEQDREASGVAVDSDDEVPF